MVQAANVELPGLDCGMCGYRTCDELHERLTSTPDMLKRCIHLSDNKVIGESQASLAVTPSCQTSCETTCGACRRRASEHAAGRTVALARQPRPRIRFLFGALPRRAGAREIIIPHNPTLTRDMDIRVGDILIGRPLGMSCGCPITHCGVATEVDKRTGVISWCVTGPLGPRQHGFKDLGYYIAEGYEGLVNEARCELKVGMRYYFQPRMCMLQWRHSGLVNYLSRNGKTYQIRVEGLWIG